MSWEKAIEMVLRHEGGYANDPHDPGGETKYGISKRTYPDLDIRNLTLEQAAEIYQRDWWDRHGFGRLPEPLDAKVFDLAVNMGAKPAVALLQRALRAAGHPVTVDGILGSQTITAARAANPEAVLAALRAEAANKYERLAEGNPALRKYLRGWLNRAYA